MKRKTLLAVVSILLCIGLLVGCTSTPSTPAPASQQTSGTKVTENAPMQYMKNDALAEAIKSGKEKVVILDVRKAADYEKSHIKNAISADLDAAKAGNNESGIANLKAALKKATGKETGEKGHTYVLLCYSGKTYAQKGTDLLITMGVDASDIYTLEDGYKGWKAADLLLK